jgi:hypothetical protein
MHLIKIQFFKSQLKFGNICVLGLCGSPMGFKVRIPLECKQFFGASSPAKLEYYPICVDEALYMDLKFT